MPARMPVEGCRACDWRYYRRTPCRAHIAEAEARELAWYEQTGHCGLCGDPGVFCTCPRTTKCGCRDRHEVGSGLMPDAINGFAEEPILVGYDQPDQDDLFGGAVS